MAQAMIENNDFRSSHQDLTIWTMGGSGEEEEGNNNNSNDMYNDSDNDRQEDPSPPPNMATAFEEALVKNNNSNNDSSSNNRNDSSSPGRSPSIIRTDQNTNNSHKRSEGRSVVIQVPPKRQKIIDPSVTARSLAHDISTSASPMERMDALQRAKDFLDHSFAVGHDDEITEGIDVALVKQLVLLVFKISRCRHAASNGMNAAQQEENIPALLDEVCTALEAMEMIYRASDTAVGDSFRKVGPDLLHVLVTLVDDELNRRVIIDKNAQNNTSVKQLLEDESHSFKPISQKEEDNKEGGEPTTMVKQMEQIAKDSNNDESGGTGGDIKDDDSTPELQRPITPLFIKMGSPEGNFLIKTAIKVMGNFARVGKATKPLAYFPGLLNCMLNLINYQPYDSIPWEARLSALWILGNLACNPENMQMMMCTPGLVRSLVRVGCRALHPDDPMEVTMEVLRSRALSSRALLNLSWSPENKIPLSENFALVELLAQLAVHRKAPALNNSRTVRDILHQTRCHAVGALRNLAAAPRRTKLQLCDYKNGHVLDALTDVALNDPDEEIQNRAFAAIHNLAVHDTAEKIIARPALVLALKDILLEEDGDGTNSDNNNNASGDAQQICKKGSSRSHASATLLVLERTITPEMESYENLRDLLDAINPTVPTDDEGDPNSCVNDVTEV